MQYDRKGGMTITQCSHNLTGKHVENSVNYFIIK